jgi:hypothetical protein
LRTAVVFDDGACARIEICLHWRSVVCANAGARVYLRLPKRARIAVLIHTHLFPFFSQVRR